MSRDLTVTTRQTLKRIARLERLMLPQYDADGNTMITLEELCRMSWNADKKKFKKMASGTIYQVLVNQFQAAEDSEAAVNVLRRVDAKRTSRR